MIGCSRFGHIWIFTFRFRILKMLNTALKKLIQNNEAFSVFEINIKLAIEEKMIV